MISGITGEVARTRPVARPNRSQDDAAVVKRIKPEDDIADSNNPTIAVATPATSHCWADRLIVRKRIQVTATHQAMKVAAPRGPVATNTAR